MIEEQIAQGNNDVIALKFEGLCDGKYGYPRDSAQAKEFLEKEKVKLRREKELSKEKRAEEEPQASSSNSVLET